jgi:hypothetical protein
MKINNLIPNSFGYLNFHNHFLPVCMNTIKKVAHAHFSILFALQPIKMCHRHLRVCINDAALCIKNIVRKIWVIKKPDIQGKDPYLVKEASKMLLIQDPLLIPIQDGHKKVKIPGGLARDFNRMSVFLHESPQSILARVKTTPFPQALILKFLNRIQFHYGQTMRHYISQILNQGIIADFMIYLSGRYLLSDGQSFRIAITEEVYEKEPCLALTIRIDYKVRDALPPHAARSYLDTCRKIFIPRSEWKSCTPQVIVIDAFSDSCPTLKQAQINLEKRLSVK